MGLRLYRAELYKLCHRKIFMIGAALVIGINALAFLGEVSNERATVDGVTYTGREAIRVNRQITEEFKGVLTDEKVTCIVEKYGFPQEVMMGYGHFMDANFLNDFVTTHLSDGYLRGWDDYRIATRAYPIAETELGEAKERTGKDIILEYYAGWYVFRDYLPVGMMLGSILCLFGISVVFANEGTTKMMPLLFTTKEGREKDVGAKVAAAFTVAFGIWAVILLWNLLLLGITYGYDGLDCFAGMDAWVNSRDPVTVIPLRTYIGITIGMSFAALLSLCGITVCVSAHCRSSFHAVVTAAACWGVPLLILVVFPILTVFAYGMPMLLVWTDILSDTYSFWQIPIYEAAVVLLLCTICGYCKYKKQDAG